MQESEDESLQSSDQPAKQCISYSGSTAVQLISIEQSTDFSNMGQFILKVHSEHLQFFEKIPENVDIKIITIMGRAGQGKSTLANLIVHSLQQYIINNGINSCCGSGSGDNFKPAEQVQNYFKVGHGSAKATQGLYFFPRILHRQGQPQEQIIVFDLEGIGSNIEKELPESQKRSYERCIYQLSSLAELFSSVSIYNTMDIRLTENHIYDIRNIGFENNSYRRNLRYICFRDSTKKKEEQFRVDLKSNKELQELLSYFNGGPLFLPRPMDDESLGDDDAEDFYENELNGRLGQALLSKYPDFFNSPVLSHLTRDVEKKMKGWQISYKLKLYVNLLNRSDQGLFLQIELFRLVQNFENNLQSRIEQLFDQEKIKQLLIKKYKDIISRESIRFCLIQFQQQLQSLLLSDLDLQIQTKLEEVRILRKQFERKLFEQKVKIQPPGTVGQFELQRNQSIVSTMSSEDAKLQALYNCSFSRTSSLGGALNRQCSNISLSQTEKDYLQHMQDKSRYQAKLDLISSRNARIQMREANLLARRRNLELQESLLLDKSGPGPKKVNPQVIQAITDEKDAIIREQRALDDEKMHIRSVTLNTILCVAGSVAGSTLANLIQGRYKSGKKILMAKEIVIETLIGTAIGISANLTRNYGGHYFGLALNGVFHLRSAGSIYRNKYFTDHVKANEMKKVAASTVLTIGAGVATLLATSGLGIAISVSVLSSFATQAFQNWLFSRRKDANSAISQIINRQSEHGFWIFNDNQQFLEETLKIKSEAIQRLRTIKDKNKIFINSYLQEITEVQILPEFQYYETGYTDDVKLTQLIIHIIGYYALKDVNLDKQQEKAINLALQFIEDYPVELFLKEIYNTQELFSSNFNANINYLYESQIQEDIDIQQINTEILKRGCSQHSLLSQDNATQQQKEQLLRKYDGEIIRECATTCQSQIKAGQWMLTEKLCNKLNLKKELLKESVPQEIIKQFENINQAVNLWLTFLCIQTIDPSFVLTYCVQKAINWLSLQNYYLIDTLESFQDILRSTKHVYSQQ